MSVQPLVTRCPQQTDIAYGDWDWSQSLHEPLWDTQHVTDSRPNAIQTLTRSSLSHIHTICTFLAIINDRCKRLIWPVAKVCCFDAKAIFWPQFKCQLRGVAGRAQRAATKTNARQFINLTSKVKRVVNVSNKQKQQQKCDNKWIYNSNCQINGGVKSKF